jgi:hypothetical protein
VLFVVDEPTGSLYRGPTSAGETLYTTSAPLWGAAVGFLLLLAAFQLMKAAGLTSWPDRWLAKFVLLYLCVIGGAVLHIASLSLSSIRFDDRLQIYAAATGLEWLQLRWLAFLRLLIPVVVVTGSLWGAGNVPARFQDLGVAILAGYSADSLFRTSLAKVHAQADPSQAGASRAP